MLLDERFNRDISARLAIAIDSREVGDIVHSICTAMGFTYYELVIFLPLDLDRPFLIEAKLTPTGAASASFSNTPISRQLASSAQAFIWDELNYDQLEDQNFLRHLEVIGSPAGLSAPVAVSPFGKGHLSLSRFAAIPTDWSHRHALSITLGYFAQKILDRVRQIAECYHSHVPVKNSYLSNRERDCLSMIANGYNGEDIARSLALSTHTVKFHLRQTMKKLNVTSREAAITRALLSGQLNCHVYPRHSVV